MLQSGQRSYSSTDRTEVSGTSDVGSIPAGGTLKSRQHNSLVNIRNVHRNHVLREPFLPPHLLFRINHTLHRTRVVEQLIDVENDIDLALGILFARGSVDEVVLLAHPKITAD